MATKSEYEKAKQTVKECEKEHTLIDLYFKLELLESRIKHLEVEKFSIKNSLNTIGIAGASE